MPTLIIRTPRLQSPNPSPSRSQSQSHSQNQSQSRSPSPIPFGASPLVTTPTEMSHREAGALSSEEEEEEDHLARLRRRLTRTKQKAKSVRREPRWQKLLSEWGLLLTLENAGSVARDHLASERTFLAYARTSLTISSTGVGACFIFLVLSLAVMQVTLAHLVLRSFATVQRSYSYSPCRHRRRTAIWRDLQDRSGLS